MIIAIAERALVDAKYTDAKRIVGHGGSAGGAVLLRTNMGPGSAAHRLALRCVRGTNPELVHGRGKPQVSIAGRRS